MVDMIHNGGAQTGWRQSATRAVYAIPWPQQFDHPLQGGIFMKCSKCGGDHDPYLYAVYSKTSKTIVTFLTAEQVSSSYRGD